MTKKYIAVENAGAPDVAGTSSSENIPPKIKFQRDYPNFFSRLTRYVHNDDIDNAIKTANEFKTAADEACAPKISELIGNVKSALYERNRKKASSILDEVNLECLKHFMKTSTAENPCQL
ncbi:MAG TPA: hypothetical protein PKK26_05790 [Candidatus Wallbacteria bacterium]|nr:hypothetical protein [Candidatus Wallbacteria bacterium]